MGRARSSALPNADQTHFDEYGRLWLKGALSERELAPLDRAVDSLPLQTGRLAPTQGVKDILGKEGPLGIALQPFLPGAFPTRVVAFSKTSNSNWAVPWHQDRVISVAARKEVDWVSNWSKKTGVWHCEPPLEVLRKMLFVRIHLDDETAGSGSMEIAPRSHCCGIVPAEHAEKIANSFGSESYPGERGDVLVLNMLMLHRSKPSKSTGPRRVIRVDFANTAVPAPLEWGDWSL